MKSIGYSIILLAIIIGCASTGDVKKDSAQDASLSDTLRIANDSLEYEIIIIEPGFNAWLTQQPPRGFYEQFWLENRNIILVNQYNFRTSDPTRFDPLIYQQRIDYRQHIDYGYEVNYLLFNWFKFFQERYRQDLGLSRRTFIP